jgi:hypothetical protein
MAFRDKSILDLPIIEDTNGFWVLGSKQGITPEQTFSGRYSLSDFLDEFAKKLQLERRLSLTMETAEMTMLIGERMTIYRVEASNVSSVAINGQTVSVNANVNIEIQPMTLVKFAPVRTLTDATAYLFIYAKAILP